MWQQGWLFGALLTVAVFLAYQQSWHAGFIWDDDEHLTQNPCVVGPLGFKEIWTTAAARICPLVISSFRLQHAFWGLNPLPYHLVNIGLHAGSCLVLWRVLRYLNVPAAWFGAALWALHPVQVESVAWITELKNTQSGFFYLLSILFFLRWRSTETTAVRGKELNYALAVFLGALAMASKSSTVVLPVVLGLCAWWNDGHWRWRNCIRLVPFLLLAGAASALSLWTQSLEGANDLRWALNIPERIAVTGKVVWFYLAKLAWPHPLVFIYPRWEVDVSRVVSFASTFALGPVLFFLWWKRDRQLRPVFFALLYFVVALLPVLGLLDHFFLRYSFVGDHFQYLASVGPLALVGAAMSAAVCHWKAQAPWLGPVSYGAVLSVLGLLTWRQCTMYADSETLWRTTVSRNPTSWMAQNNLGGTLLEKGELNQAISHFENSLRLRPDHAEARSNIGLARFRKGEVDEAISDYQIALTMSPNEDNTHYHMANALLAQGRVDDALSHYQAAARTKATAELHNNVGLALFRKRRIDEAVAEYRSALLIKPAYSEAHYNLGIALERKGELREAVTQYERAILNKPGYIAAQNNLAWLLATSPADSIRNGPRAVLLAEEANRLSGGQELSILDTLAAGYADAGRFSEAVQTAEKALQIASTKSDSGVIEDLRTKISLYKENRPFRAAQAGSLGY